MYERNRIGEEDDEYSEKLGKKTIDIYDLVFEYRKKPVLQWFRRNY